MSADTEYSELEAAGNNNFFSVTSEFDDARDLMIGLIQRYQWSNIAIIHDDEYANGTKRVFASMRAEKRGLETCR